MSRWSRKRKKSRRVTEGNLLQGEGERERERERKGQEHKLFEALLQPHTERRSHRRKKKNVFLVRAHNPKDDHG